MQYRTASTIAENGIPFFCCDGGFCWLSAITYYMITYIEVHTLDSEQPYSKHCSTSQKTFEYRQWIRLELIIVLHPRLLILRIFV